MRFFQDAVIPGRVSEYLPLLCGKDGTLSPLLTIYSPARINCLFNHEKHESRENLMDPDRGIATLARQESVSICGFDSSTPKGCS